jgi:hypothetical protein
VQLGQRDVTPTFTVEQMTRDLKLILDAGEASHVPLLQTAMTLQLMQAATARGDALDDYAAIIKAVERSAGLNTAVAAGTSQGKFSSTTACRPGWVLARAACNIWNERLKRGVRARRWCCPHLNSGHRLKKWLTCSARAGGVFDRAVMHVLTETARGAGELARKRGGDCYCAERKQRCASRV